MLLVWAIAFLICSPCTGVEQNVTKSNVTSSSPSTLTNDDSLMTEEKSEVGILEDVVTTPTTTLPSTTVPVIETRTTSTEPTQPASTSTAETLTSTTEATPASHSTSIATMTTTDEASYDEEQAWIFTKSLHDEELRRISIGVATCPMFEQVTMGSKPIWKYENCAGLQTKCYMEIYHDGIQFLLSSGCANGEYGGIKECEKENLESHCVHKLELNGKLYYETYCCAKSGYQLFETFPYKLFWSLESPEYSKHESGMFFYDTSYIFQALLANEYKIGENRHEKTPTANYVVSTISIILSLAIAGVTIFITWKHKARSTRDVREYQPVSVFERNNVPMNNNQ